MGQVLHGSARTTEAIRRAIQHSQESLRALARRYGVNQKTVAKSGSGEPLLPTCRPALVSLDQRCCRSKTRP
jgi:hypothetical protein